MRGKKLLTINTPTHTHKKQDGSDLTQLWQCAHTSMYSHSSTFEQSGQWNPVNTEW